MPYIRTILRREGHAIGWQNPYPSPEYIRRTRIFLGSCLIPGGKSGDFNTSASSESRRFCFAGAILFRPSFC